MLVYKKSTPSCAQKWRMKAECLFGHIHTHKGLYTDRVPLTHFFLAFVVLFIHCVLATHSSCHPHLCTGLPNKACPRLRDLATALARGITQPRTNLIREHCIPCACSTRNNFPAIFSTIYKLIGWVIIWVYKMNCCQPRSNFVTPWIQVSDEWGTEEADLNFLKLKAEAKTSQMPKTLRYRDRQHCTFSSV